MPLIYSLISCHCQGKSHVIEWFNFPMFYLTFWAILNPTLNRNISHPPCVQRPRTALANHPVTSPNIKTTCYQQTPPLCSALPLYCSALAQKLRWNLIIYMGQTFIYISIPHPPQKKSEGRVNRKAESISADIDSNGDHMELGYCEIFCSYSISIMNHMTLVFQFLTCWRLEY